MEFPDLANNLKNRVIYIDTTMSQSYQTTLANPEKLGLRVVAIKLIGGASNATSATITDINSNVLAEMQALTGATDYQMFPAPLAWSDFIATVTGTGAILLIYTV